MTQLTNPMVPLPYRVEQVHRENQDTFTLLLEAIDHTNNFTFLPGQFNMLYLHGIGEIPISICSNPVETRMLAHTLRAVGTVTEAMHRLKKGDIIGVRGPFGSHWPLVEAQGQDIIFVAGGIGLAPLRPAIYQALHDREKYRKVLVLYGARTSQDALYKNELSKWRGRFDVTVEVTTDRAIHGWLSNVGVVSTLISRMPFDPLNSMAMICGPEIMMRYTWLELEKRGLPQKNVYISMERNMQCAVGFCGHCQLGSTFVCKDGPVFRFDSVSDWFNKWEV
jgi:NAD(P)H-flavin reductase